MKRKQITWPIALKIVHDILLLIPETNNGTYNHADPTQFSKGGIELAGVKLSFYDNSYSTEIKIELPRGHDLGYFVYCSLKLNHAIFGDKESIETGTWEKGHWGYLRRLTQLYRDKIEANRKKQEEPEQVYPDYYDMMGDMTP